MASDPLQRKTLINPGGECCWVLDHRNIFYSIPMSFHISWSMPKAWFTMAKNNLFIFYEGNPRHEPSWNPILSSILARLKIHIYYVGYASILKLFLAVSVGHLQ